MNPNQAAMDLDIDTVNWVAPHSGLTSNQVNSVNCVTSYSHLSQVSVPNSAKQVRMAPKGTTVVSVVF